MAARGPPSRRPRDRIRVLYALRLLRVESTIVCVGIPVTCSQIKARIKSRSALTLVLHTAMPPATRKTASRKTASRKTASPLDAQSERLFTLMDADGDGQIPSGGRIGCRRLLH